MDDRFDFMVTQLRKAVLEFGATLVLASAAGEGTNIESLQDCIYHRVFDFPLKHPAKVVGSADDFSILVPTGYDSEGNITIGAKSGDDSKSFATLFPEFAEYKEESNGQEKSVYAMSNEDFFRKLQANLKGEVYQGEKKFTKFFKSLINK